MKGRNWGTKPNLEGSMGFYSRVIFPRLCNFALNNQIVAKRRQELLAATTGDVLEIGFGTGLNLLHYSPEVRSLAAIEPSIGMGRMARERIERSLITVELHRLAGESLPFADDAFDCAVSTFTLCSIGDVDQALREIYRVLKPGGRFLFLEHGLSPDPGIQLWQRRLNWLQMRLGAGCHLTRNIGAMVAAQSFASLVIDESYLPKTPKTHGYVYQGVGTK